MENKLTTKEKKKLYSRDYRKKEKEQMIQLKEENIELIKERDILKKQLYELNTKCQGLEEQIEIQNEIMKTYEWDYRLELMKITHPNEYEDSIGKSFETNNKKIVKSKFLRK